MSFFTLLGDVIGGRGVARENAQKDKLAQDQLDQTKAYNDATIATDKQRLASEQETAKIQRAKATADMRASGFGPDGQPLAPLPVPPELSKYQNDPAAESQRYSRLATWAANNGRPDLAATYQKASEDAALSAQRTSGAALNTARVDLTKAQAGWWKQRHSEVMSRLQNQMKIATMADQQKANAAGLSARTRLQTAGMNNDAREYVAQLTALNTLNRMNETQAFQAAMAQYNQSNADWRAYATDLSKPGGTSVDFNTAPASQPPQINIPAAGAPQVVVVPITLPDGTTKQVPIFRPPTPSVNKNPGGNDPNAQAITDAKKARAGGMSAADIVQRGLKANQNPQTIRYVLSQAGYPSGDIDAAFRHHIGPLALPF